MNLLRSSYGNDQETQLSNMFPGSLAQVEGKKGDPGKEVHPTL